MDLNQLKTFVMVAETASLTRAASLLCLSQPAVSAHIKSLESEFNVRLFNRTSRSMKLTATGILLRDEACVALDAAKNFVNKARFLNEDEAVMCSLGTISIPVILNLPGVLSHLRQRYQNVNLTIQQNISGRIIDQLLSSELDAGFVIGDIRDNKLGVLSVSPITLCIVGPWSWRDRLQKADWKSLQEFPWIATPEKCSFNPITREFFDRNNASFTPTMTVDQEETLTELVSMELDLTLMREDIALPAQDLQQLYIWPKAKTLSQLCFIWSRSRASSPIVSTLIDTVRTL